MKQRNTRPSSSRNYPPVGGTSVPLTVQVKFWCERLIVPDFVTTSASTHPVRTGPFLTQCQVMLIGLLSSEEIEMISIVTAFSGASRLTYVALSRQSNSYSPPSPTLGTRVFAHTARGDHGAQ